MTINPVRALHRTTTEATIEKKGTQDLWVESPLTKVFYSWIQVLLILVLYYEIINTGSGKNAVLVLQTVWQVEVS